MKTRNFVLSTVVASILTIVGLAGSANAWGPERPTFKWDKPAEYATFNSMENNPTLGDERNFVRIREAGTGTYVDEIALQVGKEYEVYTYYHNNARPGIGMTEQGMASNVRMSSSFPATVSAGEKAMVQSTISADDSNPKKVWDEAHITSASKVYLRYVNGSGKIFNGGQLNGQGIPADYLFSDGGVLLGYNTFSGIIPGCNEYAGYVTYRFKVDQPNFELQKQVSKLGENNFVESVKAKPGEEIEFKVSYKNTGTMTQENVHIKEIIPTGLTYVAGSTKLYNGVYPDGKAVNDDVVSGAGINIGHYDYDTSGYVIFRVKVGSKDDFSCGDTTLRNVAAGITGDGEKEDDATVVVETECEPDECRPGIPNGDPRCDDTPVVPEELPKTGPAEVVIAAIVIAAVGVAATYWIRSKKLVKGMKNKAEGRNKDGELLKAKGADKKSEKTDKGVAKPEEPKKD